MVIQQQVTKKTWEEEFSSGRWNGLENSPAERARHAIIGMYLDFFCPNGNILDVGCGLGTTTDFLNSEQKSKYLGIDISETAIREATAHKVANFKVADFSKLQVEEEYDAIIFNEVLYYMDEESSLLRALSMLKRKGLIIVSLYRQKKMHYSDTSIWKLCRKYFASMESIEISGVVKDGRTVTWRIDVYGNQGFNKNQDSFQKRRSGNPTFNIRKILKSIPLIKLND
jgi:SAM-dependent methyltransferase